MTTKVAATALGRRIASAWEERLSQSRNKETMSSRLDHAEKWATIFAAVVAACALIATAIFSSQSLDAANKSLNETRSQGWGVQGAQNCADYRDQVKALWEKDVPEREIRAWFAAEKGGAQNPYVKGGGKTGLDDLEGGCAHLDLLLAVLDPRGEPTKEMLTRDNLSESDLVSP
jgi:hypothetical protein